MEERRKMKLRMVEGRLRVLYEDRDACPSLKLVVDARAGRVLYAEAATDAVYFLFSLLTQGFLEEDLVVGSIGNLYSSFKTLDGDASNLPPFPPPLAGEPAPAGRRHPAPVGSRFANGNALYAVLDDLRVVPISDVNGILLRTKHTGTVQLQEKTVTLGSTEGWEIWMASLRSKTALTNAFIRKKKKPSEHPALGKALLHSLVWLSSAVRSGWTHLQNVEGLKGLLVLYLE